MGEKVQFTPAERASAAEIRASSTAIDGSKLLAEASGVGKIVNWPCTTSSPTSTGMPCGDCSTATRWSALVAAALPGQKTQPSPPRTAPSASAIRGCQTICSCASLSRQVSAASTDSGVLVITRSSLDPRPSSSAILELSLEQTRR